MSEWWQIIPQAIGGAIAAIIGAIAIIIAQSIHYRLQRPKLEIDFEDRNEKKPYIPDLNNENMYAPNRTYRVKCFRLIVCNKGKRPAMDCEAKLEINTPQESSKVALHWSRRDPALYKDGNFFGNAEKVFAPISLNINDEEAVDVLQLTYSFSTLPDTDHSPKLDNTIESVSLRQLVLQPKTTYRGIVTVYSSNTTPKSFEFKVDWDGTVEGFNKAFTKG